MDRYAAARVASILGDYFDLMKDAQGRYEAYLTKTRSVLKGAPLRQPVELLQPRSRSTSSSTTQSPSGSEGANRSEGDWQR